MKRDLDHNNEPGILKYPKGLTRIFHTDHLRKPGSQMDAALISKSSSGSVYTHSRSQPLQPPRHDQYEIPGLGIACIALSTVLFLTSCAHRLPTYEKPLARAALQKVRTTAYTHSESGHHRYGARSALGTPLKYGALNSAAADWARWPAGTRFRIKTTGENFIVDDYGFALAGTNTIDLYKPTPKGMSEWGVRRATIEIIEWGDPWRSYMLLSKVKGYRHIHRMLQEIRKFFPK